MKSIIIALLIISLPLFTYGQTQEYQQLLKSYMDEFKRCAYFDDERMELLDNVAELTKKIKDQINYLNFFSTEYNEMSSLFKKSNAFNEYLNCFTQYAHNDVTIDQFNYVNNELGIYPVEVQGLTCSLAKVYEIRLGQFKALFFYNKLEPSDFDYKTITVNYYRDYMGRNIMGGYVNVGGGKVRSIMYLSDQNKEYYKILSISCKMAQ